MGVRSFFSKSQLSTLDLTDLDWSNVIHHYDTCADNVHDDARAMGWTSLFTQQLRFDVMSYLVDFTNLSILDVGCGDGAFFHYLTDVGISFRYKGIDISPGMIRRAVHRYPGIDVRVANVMDVNLDEPVDVVVASGAFSFTPVEIDSYEYLRQLLQRCLSLASSHVVFNLLSTYSSQKSTLFQVFDPAKVLDIAFQLTQFVSLNHSYLPQDFTIVLSKK